VAVKGGNLDHRLGRERPPPGDYPDVDPARALGLFDKESPGWVPYWFPKERDGRKCDPSQRLDWFDKALAHFAQSAWPPQGSLSSRQRAVALSLLHMLSVESNFVGIPTRDKM